MSIDVYSSGGIGDALIVISKIARLHRITGAMFNFRMYGKHRCYEKPCNELMTLPKFLDASSHYVLSDNPEIDAKAFAHSNGSIYMNTRVDDINNPVEPFYDILQDTIPLINKHMPSNICIQVLAGRPNDGSARMVTATAIRQLFKSIRHRNIVLVGQDEISTPEDFYEPAQNKIINLCGRTGTISQALCIVRHSHAFVGQDGVLAYYAMMIGKRVVVNWHVPTLPGHYMHPSWVAHTKSLYGGSALYNFDEDTIKFLS